MIALANATVLDVAAGELLPDRTIVVEDDRIADVAAGRPPAGARVIDLRGRVVMPGLCDAHVHVTALSADFAGIERLSPSYVTAHASQCLHAMLLRGFTTVRDAGGADHGLARAIEEGLFPGPRLLFGEKALSQTGGHGDMREAGEVRPPSPCGCGLGRVCDGVAEVRRACRDIVRKGGHHIKLMASGGVSSPTDRITSTQFSTDELAAAVEEAQAAGIYCMAHAYTPEAIARGVAAGVRSIEHGNLLDEPTAALMRERGTFLVPTLVTYDALARDGMAAGLRAEMHSKIADVLDAGRKALQLAAHAGVPIAFGTDLLGDMQRHQLDEFAIRGELQSPLEVVRSATIVAARLFGMEGKIGQVAVGAQADLLVVDGNPIEDLSVLQQPGRQLRLVMKGGEIYRDTLAD